MCDLNRVQLGDLLDYEQPTRYIVSSTDYDDTYDTPVLTAGQTFILGYTNETKGIYKASKSNPVIIFDDFVTSFYLVDFDFKVKSSALKILKPKKGVNIYYVYYAMLGINFVPKEHARHWISKYSLFEISYPSLAKQQEIVSHLDTFSTLISNLESELDMRRKQYEHYRNQLLDFEGVEGVEWKTLGEVGNVCMCKRIMKEETSEQGDIPFFKIGTFGGKADAYISNELYEKYKKEYSFPKKGDILISASGTIGRLVVFDGKDAYFQDSNIVWIDNDENLVNNAYLKYYYQIVEWKTDGGTIKRLYNNNLRATRIAIPSKQTQQEIVEKLDAFENLIQSLEQEIKLRKKQYEYYREKLLTFERSN